MAEVSPPYARHIQSLQGTAIEGQEIIIHGSIGRCATMQTPMPSALRTNRTVRDIDLFSLGHGKYVLEDHLEALGLDTPQPLDAGLSMLVVKDGGNDDYVLTKGFTAVPLRCPDLLVESTDAILPGTGITIRTFTPRALMAANMLEPGPQIRSSHRTEDLDLLRWLAENGVTVPSEFRKSIEEFHRAYNLSKAGMLMKLSKVYSVAMPETIKSKFRTPLHRFMLKHALRESPHI